MSRVIALCAALVGAFVGLGIGNSAYAVTYDWSYVGDTAAHSGSGTLETNVAIGPATLTSFNGTFGGSAVALLPPDSVGGNDNLILALSPSIELNFSGIAFSTAAGNWNIFYSDFESSDRLFINDGSLVTSGVFTVSEQVAQTPIPGTLPLFATGLGALGLITYRRKRKQAV